MRFLFLFVFFPVILFSQTANLPTPDKLYGQLFTDVQLNHIFADSKTFVDCTPLLSPEEIVNRYGKQKLQPGFSLKTFVSQYFRLPKNTKAYTTTTANLKQHITSLWKVLKRP